MRKFAALLAALMMLVSLAACGKGGLSLKPGGSGAGLITPDEDGVAMGYEGDTLHTRYFDMTIENPMTCTDYDGLTADEGYKFLVVDLTLYNHTNASQPMYDTDFEVVWDPDDDNAWAWPEANETLDANGEPEYSARSDKQIPLEFELGIHKTYTGVLLYQVPEDSKDFIIAYYEVGAPEEEGGDPVYGDSFYVLFSE